MSNRKQMISFMDAGRMLVAAGLTPYTIDQLADRAACKAIAARVRRLAESRAVRRYRNPAPNSAARSHWLLRYDEIQSYINNRLAERGESKKEEAHDNTITH